MIRDIPNADRNTAPAVTLRCECGATLAKVRGQIGAGREHAYTCSKCAKVTHVRVQEPS